MSPNIDIGAVNPNLRSKTTSDQDLDRLPSNLASNIGVLRSFSKNVAWNMPISSMAIKSRLLLEKWE